MDSLSSRLLHGRDLISWPVVAGRIDENFRQDLPILSMNSTMSANPFCIIHATGRHEALLNNEMGKRPTR